MSAEKFGLVLFSLFSATVLIMIAMKLYLTSCTVI